MVQLSEDAVISFNLWVMRMTLLPSAVRLEMISIRLPRSPAESGTRSAHPGSGSRAAVQHLQDLHTLLHANGDILYLRVRIYLHAVTLRQLQYLLFFAVSFVYGQTL